MQRLNKIADTSPLMEVTIKHGGKVINFNLYDEVKIQEAHIAHELANHPGVYSYLLMLQASLINKAKDIEATLKEMESDLWLFYATNSESPYYTDNGKFPTNAIVEAYINSDKGILMKRKELRKVEMDRDSIIACVKSFEVRKDLIQTLSANLRKERI